jgi:MoaD family protein
MPVEVRVPTVLRTFTRGEKQVDASGSTLREVIESLESDHPGIKDRIIDGSDLRRFVNVYVNDEDVRFLGGMEATVEDGDVVVMLPAVAGGG